jgi:hypothetical protein
MFTAALLQAVVLGKRPLRIELGARDDNLPIPAYAYFERVLEQADLDLAMERWLNAPYVVGSGFEMTDSAEILADIVGAD